MAKAKKIHLEGADAFAMPAIPSGERLHYAITLEGGGEQFLGDIRRGFRTESETRSFEHVQDEGRDLYAVTSESVQLNGNIVRLRYLLTRDDAPRAVAQHFHEETADGVFVEDRKVNLDALLAPFPAGTFPSHLVSFYVRCIKDLDGGSADVISWTDRMQVVPFSVKCARREEVTVPAGAFECDVYELETDMGKMMPGNKMFSMMGKFMSNALTFWRTADEVRRVVKTTTPTGPPSSPQMIMELTSVES